MTYEQTRDSEQLRLSEPAIDDFINQYRNAAPANTAWSRQTMFFFPGGMASALKRATQAYQEGGPANQQFNYETAWLTFDTFLGEALDLKMVKDAQGVFRDKDDRIIVACGAVGMLGCTPHVGFVDWCAKNNIDLFVFAWDWRRRLDEAATFFVAKFLPFFKARVMAAGCPDPLARFSLIGHSFGGMIINLILRGEDPMVANLDKIISVASPFYGYGGQAHRWFEGEHLLNGPFNIYKRRMVKVISSMPGLYTLHFLDLATYTNSTIQAALAADPLYPLNAYPSMDTTTANLPADPYNPLANGALVRYPANTGFDKGELDYAELMFRHLAAPMAEHLQENFFHIRGVRPVHDTVGSVTCGWVAPNFDPLMNASPIVDGPMVAGDDTQPAFTARLATNHLSRVFTVTGPDIQHAFMMNCVVTHDAVASILSVQGVAVPLPAPAAPTPQAGASTAPAPTPQATPGTPQPAPPSTPAATVMASAIQGAPTAAEVADKPLAVAAAPAHATSEEALAFVHWLHKTHKKGKKDRKAPLDHETVLKTAPPEFRDRLGHVARRIMMDLMNRPAPKGAPADGKSVPAVRKTARIVDAGKVPAKGKGAKSSGK